MTSEINLVEEPEYWAGGHGLYSTPRDYIKFQRALLGGGEVDRVRILTQSTVDAAFTNQIGELDFPAQIPPPTRRRPTHSPPARDTSGARPAARPQTSRECAGRTAVAGPGCSTATSGWTRPLGSAVDLQQLPAVWSAGGDGVYANFERAVYSSR